MANIKDFIKKIGNSAVSIEEQQQALAQVEKTIIEAKQKRTEAVGKNADMVIQALKTIEAKLEAKLNELNNTPAKQGVQGPVGKDGKDGKNGKAGRDGLNGKDGTDGKDGVDGKDGISVVDAKIDFDGSLVVYLSNGSEIDCGQILSPDVAQNIIINSGGSGTSQTVTDTLVSLQNQIDTLTGIDGVLGSMAQQNANSVAITGGTINGTTIGATTPSSIVGTTITGQTGVLRGTGQNAFLQSQTFTTTWALNNATATGSATTAPDGTSTGTKLAENATTNTHFISQSIAMTGTTVTVSVYAKQSERIRLLIRENSVTGASATFDVSTGTVVATAGSASGDIVSVGSGWYRCSMTRTYAITGTTGFGIFVMPNAGTTFADATYAGTAGNGLFIWGAQAELGSTANTYIPTTTTAVYGTPTLSFSGVSEIGLLSNGALYLQPAGTGAIQAQQATSTAAGGNVRGANATDFQKSRFLASQVASGSSSTIGGGLQSTASGYASTVAGGDTNTASAGYSSVVGGNNNIASGNQASVVNGISNSATGFYGFVGNGFTNSTTSNSTVTTQSGTMNATTAVTLSGSNASIKVGQYIQGTSIASDTYVAAISGTSLTLSKNASGSSTSTLSFFTPHGVVVGGGNNQATGSYSFIGGGGDAGTAANRNVASGDWSVVAGGRTNTASGNGAVVAGGGYYNGVGASNAGNTASGDGAFIGGGFSNSAQSFGTSILGGNNNTANATYSVVLGSQAGITRGIQGNTVSPASATPIGSPQGSAQSALLVLGVQTTDATPTALRSNTSAAGTTNQVILPNNSAYFFRGEVISGKTAGGDAKGWTIEGVIKRGANAASTTLVGTPTVTSSFANAGASAWTIAVTADTTNGGLRVTFTGQASTTIRTVAQIRTTEMTY